MEGNWRVASLAGVVLACCAIGAAAGCGSDSSGSSAGGIETRNPEATFAPLVRLHPQERWLPMPADWFLERSIFWFADDQGCADRPIAVGGELEDLWSPAIDWLDQSGLGRSPEPYFRTPYARAVPGYDVATNGTPCPFREGYRFFANQQTRLYEEEDRVKGLRLTEGYYVDLVDRARRGPQRGGSDDAERSSTAVPAPAYVERSAQEVDGEPGLRLTYWLLYGMNQPLGSGGDPIEQSTHEGDWERVDVLLQERDEDEWAPVTVRLLDDGGRTRDVPWASLSRARSDGSATGSQPATHAVLTATRGDHALSPAPRRGDDCAHCPKWTTWSSLVPARKQPWYGFGGAWGEVGATSATTGPLGPHGKWPPDSPFNEDT